jgi:c-di-GMP-binding flagellar brake protein YcgR
MVDQGNEMLADAVARNAAAVISLRTDGELHHHKTRFLRPDEQGVWLESVAGQGRQIAALIDAAVPVGVSFRGEPHRVAFCSRILRMDKEFRVGDGLSVPAILLAHPDQITPIQRRSSYRVAVPLDSELRMRVWLIPDHAYINDRPPAAQEAPCALRNVSVGGVGMMLQPRRGHTPRVTQGQRLRLELVYREINVILEGRIRHPEHAPDDAPPGGFYVGVQFAKLEDNLEGRQTLAWINSIIGELQRDEVKRARVGD